MVGLFREAHPKQNVICLQDVHGKNDFLQAFSGVGPRFRLFGTFIPGNENAGGSAICIHKDLLPEDAIVTHVITCQARDHVVNVRSGCRNLEIASHHPACRKERVSLLNWLSDYCAEFRFGTMIKPDGHIHRWTAHRKKINKRVLKINASTKSPVERLCDYASSRSVRYQC